jgi:PRTRC genetic system protein E
MFKELAPVLRHRAVLMTITSIEDDQIRVNVVPKKLKDGEHTALTTPLTVTGTAEELDAELGSTLVDFVASHLQLKNTLKQAKADMEEAAKAAQAEARAKSKTQIKKDATASTIPSKPSQPVKATERVEPPPPRTASLFDMSAAATAPASASPASVNTESSEEEEEILTEIKEEESDDESHDEAA